MENSCDIKRMKFFKIAEDRYRVDCLLLVDFEHEGVAQNEAFSFEAEIVMDGE